MIIGIFEQGWFHLRDDTLCLHVEFHFHAFSTIELSLHFYYFLFSEAAVPNTTYSISTLRKISATMHLPEFWNSAAVFSFPWCSVLRNEASEFITYAFAIHSLLGQSLPNRSLGDQDPLSLCVMGLCRWAEAYLYTPRPCSEQHVPEHVGQGAIHKLFKILSRPKAQRYCICCTQDHGAFSWIKSKWNIFTMSSKLSSNHRNLVFFPNRVRNVEWPGRNKSFSLCSSVVSQKWSRINFLGVKPINQQTTSMHLLHHSGAHILSGIET